MKPYINHTLNISNKNNYLLKKYYIVAQSTCFLTKKQIDSCLSVISYYIKRAKKKKNFINRVQYNIPITKKNKGSRMGSGKGKIKEYISKVRMNEILFIFQNVKQRRVYKIYKQLQVRLPVKIDLIF